MWLCLCNRARCCCLPGKLQSSGIALIIDSWKAEFIVLKQRLSRLLELEDPKGVRLDFFEDACFLIRSLTACHASRCGLCATSLASRRCLWLDDSCWTLDRRLLTSLLSSFALRGFGDRSSLFIFGRRGCFDLPWLAALFHHESELTLTVIFGHIRDDQVGIFLQLGVQLCVKKFIVLCRLESLESTEGVPHFPNHLIELDRCLPVREKEGSRLNLSLLDRREFALRVFGL